MLAAMVEGGGEGESEGADGGAGEAEGDAWHALGVALLGMERWGAARAVWRRGAALAPSHELLRSQVARDRGNSTESKRAFENFVAAGTVMDAKYRPGHHGIWH